MTVPAVNVRPALPGQLLAELLPIVGEISAVLDPGELLPAIAQQLRRIVDYRILDIFLPDKDGVLVPAVVEGSDCSEQAFRLRIEPVSLPISYSVPSSPAYHRVSR
jgi:hypothetical protein